MTDNKVYFGCPGCVSFSSADSEEEAQEKVDSHNESRHDGEEVARIIEPDSEESVNEFEKAGREHAKSMQHEELVRRLARGDTPYTVATID